MRKNFLPLTRMRAVWSSNRRRYPAQAWRRPGNELCVCVRLVGTRLTLCHIQCCRRGMLAKSPKQPHWIVARFFDGHLDLCIGIPTMMVWRLGGRLTASENCHQPESSKPGSAGMHIICAPKLRSTARSSNASGHRLNWSVMTRQIAFEAAWCSLAQGFLWSLGS